MSRSYRHAPELEQELVNRVLQKAILDSGGDILGFRVSGGALFNKSTMIDWYTSQQKPPKVVSDTMEKYLKLANLVCVDVRTFTYADGYYHRLWVVNKENHQKTVEDYNRSRTGFE